MSIDLNWSTLTTGPEGQLLAESIRDFVHSKFQTIPLPRFIKSVKVHAFDFGSIAPEIELKDICDPLPDFYEETDDDYGDDGDDDDDDRGEMNGESNGGARECGREEEKSLRERRRIDRQERTTTPSSIDTKNPILRFPHLQTESPFSTPGIPGGTSNLHYFHSQLATGLSGTQTPLAAVAGAHLPAGWPDHSHRQTPSTGSAGSIGRGGLLREKESVSTLAPSSAAGTTRPTTREGPLLAEAPLSQSVVEEAEEGEEEAEEERRFREPRAEDVQTVFRVRYAGDVRLSLTAEILLDYPMPSFVGIPVKLNITGLSFDGVAVLAYIRKRAHFCFLSPDDALAAVGAEGGRESDGAELGGMKMGGLLQEIRVESEIGQREGGKSSLKNVGKVEKFVLEQVRRIFEDEFVYPSFWTFLV